MSSPAATSASSSSAASAAAAVADAHAAPRACAVCGITSSLSACSTCGQVSYCSRAHQVSHWSTHKPLCRMVEVRSSHAGSGLGLWAMKDVGVGVRLATDKPLMLVPRVNDFAQMQSIIQLRYQVLSPADQAVLHTFGDAHHHAATDKASVVGICLTNCLPASNGESAIYPTLCRANHSCSPNAEYSWQESSQRGVMHATRNIARGEEIFISYSSAAAFMPYAQRQQHLLDGFKFQCACTFCSTLAKDDAKRKESDGRRSEMHELEEKLMEESMVLTPDIALGYMEKFSSLFSDEFGSLFYSQIGRFYFRMFQILIPSKRLLDQAKKFIKLAVETYTKTKGADSDVVKAYQSLADNPQAHPDFGALDEANKSNSTAAASSSSSAATSEENKKKRKKKKKKKPAASAASASTEVPANNQDSDSDGTA